MPAIAFRSIPVIIATRRQAWSAAGNGSVLLEPPQQSWARVFHATLEIVERGKVRRDRTEVIRLRPDAVKPEVISQEGTCKATLHRGVPIADLSAPAVLVHRPIEAENNLRLVGPTLPAPRLGLRRAQRDALGKIAGASMIIAVDDEARDLRSQPVGRKIDVREIAEFLLKRKRPAGGLTNQAYCSHGARIVVDCAEMRGKPIELVALEPIRVAFRRQELPVKTVHLVTQRKDRLQTGTSRLLPHLDDREMRSPDLHRRSEPLAPDERRLRTIKVDDQGEA
jgi:hypothetical protein